MNAPLRRVTAGRTLLSTLSFALTLGFVAAAAPLNSGCQRGPATVMAERGEAIRLAADLRVQFNKATDASNRAVMADTDEASIAFAQDAKRLSASAEHDVVALAPLLKGLAGDEAQQLEKFEQQFSEYKKVDGEILSLAIENTNLKAQRLSFGPAKDAADRFKAALETRPVALSASDRCRADALVARAVIAVRELQVLQGPHIASADDVAMAAIEKQMNALSASVLEAMNGLSELVERAQLDAARGAFAEIKSLGDQIVSLSRRNTNVRSLDLALRIKPALTATCDDSLRTLQQALAGEGSKATR